MTREEFCNLRDDWTLGELFDFARDNDVAGWEDILSEDSLDDEICNDLRDATSRLYWHQIRDALDNIETGYDFYVHSGSLEFSPVDQDEFYDDIIYDMDNAGLWDDPEEEDEDIDDDEYEDDPEPEREPEIDEVQRELKAGVFSIDEFIESGAGDMMVLRADAERYEEEHKITTEVFEAAEEPVAAVPARRFRVGDSVKANEATRHKYSVTSIRWNWRGIVTEVLPRGTIRVYGRGDKDIKDSEWVVDEACFDLYHDETLDVPKEELFVF